MEKIINDDAKIKRIFFLSDIHIKNNSEEDEKYYSVFNDLFSTLNKKNFGKNDIFCICGDIMDNGFNVTPTAIKMAKYLYFNLTEMAPVITILGNHEYKTSVDSLTPIVNYHFPTKNGNHVLLDNGIYIYGNIVFGHTKFDSQNVTNCKKYNDEYITIGLYHGILNGCSFENNTTGRSHFTIDHFKDYKYCAFGDVHKFQYLNKNKTAFYVGSLIPQKRNESTYLHGCVMLDVEKGKIEFIEIDCKYKLIDIHIDDNGEVSNYDINKFKDLKEIDANIITLTKNNKHVEKLQKLFEDNGVACNFKEKPSFDVVKLDTKIKIGEKDFILSDLKTLEQFTDFFYNFVISRHNVSNKIYLKEDISELLKDANISDELTTTKNISIKEIKISNILIFGEKTGLNIENINGIFGICKTNSYGKSSLCEIISIILHGKSPRCKILKSFVRKGQRNCTGTIILEINKVLYEITRHIIFRGFKDIKTNDSYIDIKKYIGKKIVVYTDDKSKSTNKNVIFKKTDEIEKIVNSVLSYDEIYQMIVVSQDREKSFLKYDNKIALLFEASNFGFINKIAEKCGTDYSHMKKKITSSLKKELSGKFIDTFKSTSSDKDNYKKFINHVNLKILEYEKDINDDIIDKKIKNIFEKYEEGKREIVKYEEQLKYFNEFDDMCEDLNNIVKMNDDYSETIKNNKNEILKITKNMKIEEKELNKIIKQIQKFNNIEQKYDAFENTKSEIIKKYNIEISLLQKTIRRCKHVDQNDYKLATKSIKQIENDVNDIVKSIQNEEKKLKIHKNVKNLFTNYKKYIDKINDIHSCRKVIDTLNGIGKYKKIIKKIEDLKQEIKIHEIELIKCEEYKNDFDNYNPDENINDIICELYKKKDNLINEKNKYEIIIIDYDVEQQNNKINVKIEEYEKKIFDENKKNMDEYDNYFILLKKKNDFTKNINDMNIIIDKLQINNDKLQNLIDKNTHNINIITKNKEKYDKYNLIKLEYDKFLEKYKNVKIQYEIALKEKESLELKKKLLYGEIVIAKDKVDKFTREMVKIENYEIINDCLKVNGIADTIIKEIIKHLQISVDQMCNFIGHQNIYIDYIDGLSTVTKKYDILITTENITDISNSGGFESKIMDLIFKMAFLKINTYFKTDFIIIDEVYDACSEENFPMAKKLVEFFKMNYKKMLVVSHNPNIISLFDETIDIVYDNVNGNKIIMPK